MERKPDIEDQINATLAAAKNIPPSELPDGFSDRVMNRVSVRPVRSMYTISPLLKIAAVFIIIIINVFTLRLALSPQPVQGTPYVTIKDFVNEYQINDANEEIVTTTYSTPAHEQH